MPLKRGSDQKHATLEQFYTEGEHQQTLEMGAQMISLIKLINTKFKDTPIFGLTSLYRLYLHSKDTYISPSYVSFGYDGLEFHIDYLVPESKQPWPNARISGQAGTIEQAFKYILIAMKESEGWQNNIELNKLIADT